MEKWLSELLESKRSQTRVIPFILFSRETVLTLIESKDKCQHQSKDLPAKAVTGSTTSTPGKSKGGSKAQYCRDNDLSYHVFIYWHTELHGNKKPGKLVPVSVSPVNQSHDIGTLQLRLPNGMRVTGIQQDSVDLVARLVSLL